MKALKLALQFLGSLLWLVGYVVAAVGAVPGMFVMTMALLITGKPAAVYLRIGSKSNGSEG